MPHGGAFEVHVIHRFQPGHGDIVIRIPPGQLKQLAVNRRHHHQGRPHIKGKTILLNLVHFSAGDGLFFKDFHLIPRVLQPDGCGQPAHAGANHHNALFAHTPSVKISSLVWK